MKKRILLFLLSFLFVAYYGYNVEAAIFGDDPKDLLCATVLTTDAKFNVLKGSVDSEDINNFMESVNEFGTCYVEEGCLMLEGEIKNDTDSVCIKTCHYSKDFSVYKYQAYIEDFLFYEVILEDDTYQVTKNEEIDLVEYLDYDKEGFTLECDYEGLFSSDSINTTETDSDENKYYGFKLICTALYQFGNDNKVVSYVCESTNPISQDFIVNSISVVDETEGSLDFEILNNTYNVVDNYVQPGTYSFDIYSSDSYGNTTIQKCEVRVVDSKPPVVTGKDWEVTYAIKATESQLLSRFTYSDESGIKSAVITKDDYSQNYNKPGKYDVECTVTDNYNNSTVCKIVITVVDKVKPIYTIPSNIVISTLSDYSLEDFKQYITIEDSIDGVITEYTITDNDGYLNNTKQYGIYTFTVTASDKAGNEITPTFTVEVRDMDFPDIQVSTDYTIVLNEGEVMTEEQIASILEKIGQITSSEYKLSSEYFNSENPQGEYSLKVECDGKVYNNIIKITSNNINSDIPTIDSIDSINNGPNYILIFGVLAVSLLLIGGLSVIIYKKKH